MCPDEIKSKRRKTFVTFLYIQLHLCVYAPCACTLHYLLTSLHFCCCVKLFLTFYTFNTVDITLWLHMQGSKPEATTTMLSAQTDTHRHIKKATVQTHTLSLFSGHRGISGIRPLRIELLRFQRGNMSRFWSRVMDLCVWIHTHQRFHYKNHICGRQQLRPQGPSLHSQQWPLRHPSMTSVYLCGTVQECEVDNRSKKLLRPKE